MKNHTDLLNFLAETYGLNKYLEIGVYSRHLNLNKIRCKHKVGVDPAPGAGADFCGTSDDYFILLNSQPVIFDLIFIDGLHHADQVKRDFDNSLRHLSDHGFIVLHDCNPKTEDVTSVPRAKRGTWLGDVYKFICELPSYDGIDFCTVDFDHGCCVVWKDGSKQGQNVPTVNNFREFVKNRGLLRLCSPAQFMAKLQKRPIAA